MLRAHRGIHGYAKQGAGFENTPCDPEVAAEALRQTGGPVNIVCLIRTVGAPIVEVYQGYTDGKKKSVLCKEPGHRSSGPALDSLASRAGKLRHTPGRALVLRSTPRPGVCRSLLRARHSAARARHSAACPLPRLH